MPDCAEDQLYLNVRYTHSPDIHLEDLDNIARAAIEVFRGTQHLVSVLPGKLEAPAPYAVQPVGTFADIIVYDILLREKGPGTNTFKVSARYIASVGIRYVYGFRGHNIIAEAIVYERSPASATPTFPALLPQS